MSINKEEFEDFWNKIQKYCIAWMMERKGGLMYPAATSIAIALDKITFIASCPHSRAQHMSFPYSYLDKTIEEVKAISKQEYEKTQKEFDETNKEISELENKIKNSEEFRKLQGLLFKQGRSIKLEIGWEHFQTDKPISLYNL